MLKIKTAQGQDFTDLNVRRILGTIADEYSRCQQKMEMIQQINSEIDMIKGQGQLQISLQDLQGDAGLWEMITTVIGSDHWSLKPDQGTFGQ